MRCTNCHTNVVRIPINWKCPHCGERLPEPGFWFRFSEGLTEYLEEKGTVFWGVIIASLLILVGLLELVFGQGFLLRYILGSFILSAIMIFFGGMLVSMYMQVVLPLKLLGGGDYILKERAVIRNFRKGTNLAAAAGIMLCLVWLGPSAFFAYFPSYFVIVGILLALAWSIGGLFFDARMVDDVRFRGYMERLGITNLKSLRKSCAFVIFFLFIATLGFWILNQIPGLWIKVSNWGLVTVIVNFVSNYLSWLV